MKTSTRAEVTTTTEIKLDVKVHARLMTDLRAYAELRSQLNDIKEAMEALNGSIETRRDKIGEQSVTLEGFKVTRVSGQTYRKLNKKKFVAAGGSLAMLEDATENKPKKAHTKITCPGEKAFEQEEE